MAVLVACLGLASCGGAPAAPRAWASGQRLSEGPESYLSSVSCPTVTFCMAIEDSGGSYVYSGGQWHHGVEIDLSSATASAARSILDVLTSVSCTASEFCMAVTESGYSFTYSQGTWSTGAPIARGGAGFSDVSCGSPGSCFAINGPSVYAYSDGVWSSGQVLGGSNTEQLTSISCASATRCVAVGDPTNGAGAPVGGNAFVLTDGSWVEARFWPLETGYQMNSVSCPTASFCKATDSQGQVQTMSGSSWTTGNLAADVVSISCPTTGYCVGIDLSGDVHTFVDGNWLPHLPVSPNVDVYLNDVSCAAARLCVVVGTTGVAYVHSASSLQA